MYHIVVTPRNTETFWMIKFPIFGMKPLSITRMRTTILIYIIIIILRSSAKNWMKYQDTISLFKSTEYIWPLNSLPFPTVIIHGNLFHRQQKLL